MQHSDWQARIITTQDPHAFFDLSFDELEGSDGIDDSDNLDDPDDVESSANSGRLVNPVQDSNSQDGHLFQERWQSNLNTLGGLEKFMGKKPIRNACLNARLLGVANNDCKSGVISWAGDGMQTICEIKAPVFSCSVSKDFGT